MVTAELAGLYARDLTRLVHELEAFPGTASLWQTAPGVTNAAGTLALHLEGNLREYIGRQIGGIVFTRDRPLEFSRRGVEQAELVDRIAGVRRVIPPILIGLTERELTATYPEPLYDRSITVGEMVIHLYGHLGYHLGQIDYVRRVVTGDGAIPQATR